MPFEVLVHHWNHAYRKIASDAATDPNTPMPEGGWGHLNIRYNPNRALPDGINIAIDILPDITTYLENGGTLEKAQQMANHESTKTTKLYDRRNDQVTLDEIERIVI